MESSSLLQSSGLFSEPQVLHFMLLLKLANRHNLVHMDIVTTTGSAESYTPCGREVILPLGLLQSSLVLGPIWNWQPAESFEILVRALFPNVVYSILKSKEVYPHCAFFLMVGGAKYSNLTFILEEMSWCVPNYWTHETLPIGQTLESSYGLSFTF